MGTFLARLHPPHKTFVDVFGGTGVAFLDKPISPIEIYNDKCGLLTTMFKVIQGNQYQQLLQRFLRPFVGTDEFLRCREVVHNPASFDDLEVAYSVLYFGACHFSCGLLNGANRPTMGKQKIHGTASVIPLYRKRFKKVSIEQLNWWECIERYDSPDTLFYCDPPYNVTVKSPKEYYHETINHEELIDVLKTVKGMVMLSGYSNPLYNEALNDWEQHTFETRITMTHG